MANQPCFSASLQINFNNCLHLSLGKFWCILHMHEANENARSEIMCCNYDQLKRSSRNLRIKVHQLPGLQYIVYYTSDDVRTWSQRNFNHLISPMHFIAQYLASFYLHTYFDGANFKFPQLMVVDYFFPLVHSSNIYEKRDLLWSKF